MSFDEKKYPNPKVSFTLSTNTLDRKNYELSGNITSEDSVNYLWDLGDGATSSGSSFLHSYHIGTITFYKIALSATSIYNCSDSSFMLVDVIPFIPNVFSPNNDGINDLFMPGIALQIFDRNGILIYEGNKGWDGTFKNKHVTPDTYFYQVQYKNSRQEVSAKKGFVTLVR
jgi:gliding motility-associated-like protein